MAVPASVLGYARLKVIEERLCLYNQGEDGFHEKWVMEKYGGESLSFVAPSDF